MSKTKHGYSPKKGRSPTYHSWSSMRTRCENPNHRAYHRYGGRGISVCSSWRSFAAFLADMGERPSKAYSLDRIDPNGNYESANCRWIPVGEQNRNRRDNVLNESKVRRIREMQAAGYDAAEIGAVLNVDRGAVREVMIGRNWRSV